MVLSGHNWGDALDSSLGLVPTEKALVGNRGGSARGYRDSAYQRGETVGQICFLSSSQREADTICSYRAMTQTGAAKSSQEAGGLLN